MNFTEYQNKADNTAIYPDRGNKSLYPFLKLAGETGEVCEKMGKILRDKNGIISIQDQLELQKELGDVLWYINAICFELGLTLNHVAIENIKKLESRKKRGVLKGSGDNR